MSKGKKLALLIAALCVVAGLCLMGAGIIGSAFEVEKLNNNMQPATNAHTVEEAFTGIDIRTVEAEVLLLPSEDGTCRAVCEETDKVTHTVEVKNGSLTVRRQDSRRWYEKIGFFFHRYAITLYLPADSYGDLAVETVSGEITVPADFSFRNATLHSTSGNISCAAKTTGNLNAGTTSGNLTLRGHAGESLAVGTTSGEINLQQITASAISVTSVSGNIAMTDVAAMGMLQADSVSGEQWLDRTDAGSLTLTTVSGNVTAMLRSGKEFFYDTMSGTVTLPPSTPGAGECKISTTSGNIRVEVAE